MRISVASFMNSEWALYRQLRLAALKDSPDAFGTTYEQAATYTDATWQSRLTARMSEHDLALIAKADDLPAGLAWGRIDPGAPGIAHVFQMWVAPTFRGHGVARQLLEEIRTWAVDLGSHTLELSVTCGNSPARALYESFGFEPQGLAEPLRPGSALEVQPMRLIL